MIKKVSGLLSLRSTIRATVALSVLTVMTAGTALAQEPIVFPSKGQSKDQTEQDKYSCYQWAKGQTGFDPMQAPTATTPPP